MSDAPLLLRLERFRYGFYGFAITILIVGLFALLINFYRARLLPSAITVNPAHYLVLDGRPACPGDLDHFNLTYAIERPSVLEISALIWDVQKQRQVPQSEIDPVIRPQPYVLRQTIPITFSVPALPPGNYEWHLGVTAQNQSSDPSFTIIAFAVAAGCPSNDVSVPSQ